MREEQVNIYTVHEIAESALDKAYYNWCGVVGYVWSGENEATLKAFEAIFPITITGFEYGDYRRYVNFDFTEDDAIKDLSGIRLATYIYNNYYHFITQGKYYSLWSKTEKSTHNPNMGKLKERHSKIIIEEKNCALTGFYMDNEILSPIFDFLKEPVSWQPFYDLIRTCLNAWLNACVADYRHCTSLEYFTEEAESNGYEFYADGTRF